MEEKKKVEIYGSSVAGNIFVKKNQDSIEFILKANKIEFSFVDVAADDDKQKYMKRKNGGEKRLPQIFVGGEYKGELSQIRGYASKKKKKRAPFVPANALPFLDAVSVIKAMEVGWPNHTYEVHVKLGFEKGVQNVRVQEALDAGATVVGGEEIVAEIQQGTFKFGEIDRCLATPDMLPAVSKIARILGPKQLMPTLKKGTVTDDIKGAIREMAGKFEFKNDKAGIIHAENIRVLLNEIDEQGKAHLSKSKSRPKSIISEVCLNATRAPGIYILDYKDIMSGEKLKFMELNYQDLSLMIVFDHKIDNITIEIDVEITDKE
ncbi:2351_t:CDS:2 [Diversispora eburnea]|uniref:2351_t:CDS:1 n=1 Tax=Diversispora eburnea TaxID=1213867 RepID=A0A9N8V3B9_9GLOM|nr:2351_t:CDS:2 [Diversispora eburnea]